MALLSWSRPYFLAGIGCWFPVLFRFSLRLLGTQDSLNTPTNSNLAFFLLVPYLAPLTSALQTKKDQPSISLSDVGPATGLIRPWSHSSPAS